MSTRNILPQWFECKEYLILMISVQGISYLNDLSARNILPQWLEYKEYITSLKNLAGTPLAFSCSRYWAHENPLTFLRGSESDDDVDCLSSLPVSSSGCLATFTGTSSSGWVSFLFFFFIPGAAFSVADFNLCMLSWLLSIKVFNTQCKTILVISMRAVTMVTSIYLIVIMQISSSSCTTNRLYVFGGRGRTRTDADGRGHFLFKLILFYFFCIHISTGPIGARPRVRPLGSPPPPHASWSYEDIYRSLPVKPVFFFLDFAMYTVYTY